jgi:hypothetical protein
LACCKPFALALDFGVAPSRSVTLLLPKVLGMAIIQELKAEGKDLAVVRMSDLPLHGNEKFSTDPSTAECQQKDPKEIARRLNLSLFC